MKCLFIKQPYCDLIAENKKIYEIRSWRTNYRGTLLICASKKAISNNYNGLPSGCTICIVDLIDIIPFTKKMEKNSFVNHSKRQWAWVLKNPVKIKHIHCSGRLGLFEAPTYLKDAVIRPPEFASANL